MRVWLIGIVVALFAALSVPAAALAGGPHSPGGHPHGHGHAHHGHGHHPGHGHGKPDLPPIDTSNAANCDFIAQPGNPVCMLPPPPYENLPNRVGEDPHGLPRATAAEQQLVSDFFAGAIPESDNCGGGPCFSGTFSGP